MLIDISEDTSYEVLFQHIQFEITGACNMKCAHCRAWEEPKVNLPIDTIKQIMIFGENFSVQPFLVTVSGGEPFMRSDLPEIIGLISESPVQEIIITTNGWFNDPSLLRNLRQVRNGLLTIQVSLDSINSKEHDTFRKKPGSFSRAIKTLRLAFELGFTTSVRMSVRSANLGEMSKMIELATSLRANRVGFGPIIPTGRAKNRYLMTPGEKKSFHEELAKLRVKNSDKIEVTTEDPLKFALNLPRVWDNGGLDPNEDGVFGGCTAGISSFNVGSAGVITPCAVLPIPIVETIGRTSEEIENIYKSSPVIQSLFGRSFSGSCGKCSLRRICGGCRAIPYGIKGDYLAEDSSCWTCDIGHN